MAGGETVVLRGRLEVENEGVERVGSRSKEEKRCAFGGLEGFAGGGG